MLAAPQIIARDNSTLDHAALGDTPTATFDSDPALTTRILDRLAGDRCGARSRTSACPHRLSLSSATTAEAPKGLRRRPLRLPPQIKPSPPPKETKPREASRDQDRRNRDSNRDFAEQHLDTKTLGGFSFGRHSPNLALQAHRSRPAPLKTPMSADPQGKLQKLNDLRSAGLRSLSNLELVTHEALLESFLDLTKELDVSGIAEQ